MFPVLCSRFRDCRSPFRGLLFTVFLFSVTAANAQHALLTNSDERILVDRYLNTTDGRFTPRSITPFRFHTSVKPYVNADVSSAFVFTDSTHGAFDSVVHSLAARFSNSN